MTMVFPLLVLCILADDPIGEWIFDRDHVHNSVVTAVHGPDGTIVGGVAGLVPRESPASLQLNGTPGSSIAVQFAEDSSQLPRAQLTIEAWVQIEKPLEWGGVVGFIQDNGDFERGWLLGYRKSRFCFGVASEKTRRLNYLTAPTNFELGNWYYIVGTYDGASQRLYVDGELKAESKRESGEIVYPPRGQFHIGAYHDENEHYPMTGLIESAVLWDSCLTPELILDRFHKQRSRFPGIVPEREIVEDWPTYLRDNLRTGITTETLPTDLKLLWVHTPTHPPNPAWPAPAQQDFWHKKSNLKARVVFDRCSQPVVSRGRLFVGSSSENKVLCLDARTGEELWEFLTAAPVRLAPTVVEDRVLFGGDDGRVHCLDARDGTVLWQRRAASEERWIPGNERVMSLWPIRTGILVENGIAYCCAGLFPKQGVFQFAFDIESGEKLAEGAIEVAAQGYLERRDGQLYVATGRDPAGSFVSRLARRGKGLGREKSFVESEFPYFFIGADQVRVAGGDDKVAMFNLGDGAKVWESDVDGRAYGAAVASNQLFVSTDTGAIYCFGVDGASFSETPPLEIELPAEFVNTDLIARVHEMLARCQRRNGYALVVGEKLGPLLYQLAMQSALRVVAVVPAAEVDPSRRRLAQLGLHGRVVVHSVEDRTTYPYTDYMFNLIVAPDLQSWSHDSFEADELRRMLAPCGGVAIIDGDRTSYVRESLDGGGEWTHMYGNASNTVCSNDALVVGKMQLQWFGPPGPQNMIDRHHRTVAPVWKNGRLFIPGNNRVFGVDAYNGTVLWERSIPGSRRIGAFRDCSYLAVGEKAVYVAVGNSCLALDPETGTILETFAVPEGGSQKDWGYLAVVDDTLFGSSTRPSAARKDHSLSAINEGTFWDGRPLVCSDEVFGARLTDGTSRWRYQPVDGVVVNPTLTVGDGRVFFVESTNPETRTIETGRVAPRDLMKSTNLVALDAESGSIVWSLSIDLSAIEHNVYVSYSNGKVVVVGSRNSGSDKKTDKVFYDIQVYDSETGELQWKHTQDQLTAIGGDHGEQDHHPVVVGEKLICEPYAYDLHTGAPSLKWSWDKKHRRGCGTISASADALFFRQANPTMFTLEEGTYSKVTNSTRPGCWINMIPAGGLLLIPEASSGCTCNFAIQTSLAFLPVPD